MATSSVAAGGEPPVEPQSLKKLSLKSLKRSLDLFAPARSLLFAPDAER
jgi:pleiotropic regulator 1